jgi:hypothetical protein
MRIAAALAGLALALPSCLGSDIAALATNTTNVDAAVAGEADKVTGGYSGFPPGIVELAGLTSVSVRVCGRGCGRVCAA